MILIDTHRTRKKDNLKYYGSSSTIWGTTYNALTPYYTRYAEMRDCNNRRDGKAYYGPSPAVHLTHTVTSNYRQYGGPVWNISLGYGTYTSNGSPATYTPDDVNKILPNVPDQIWEAQALSAFNTFSTQIPTEVSIINFGWELREIGELLPKLTENLISSLAGGYLNYKFGWEPFLSDLRKLANIMSTISGRIKYLKDRAGKRTRQAIFRRGVIDDVYPFPVVHPVTTQDVTQYFGHGVFLHFANFRASSYLYESLEGLDTVYGEIRAFLAALGLGNPIKAIWDALPFTFVLGWFTRIGQHLETLNAKTPFTGKWNVTDVTCSMDEYIIVLGYHAQTLGLSDYVESGDVIEVRRYSRIAGLPVGVNSFNLSDLNPSQLLLFNALFYAHF